MRTAPVPWPAGEWRRHLSDAVRDLDELLEILELDAGDVTVDRASSSFRRFPLRVPRGFVERMRPGDPEDPLLRQVIPTIREDEDVEGFTVNPVGELGLVRGDGVLTKYHGRALVVATGVCAVHCRYCFRRHFPYAEAKREWEAAFSAIAADESVEELILSGGDPLMLSDDQLAAIAARTAETLHLRRLRIHSRMPVVLPERVDEALVRWMGECPIPLVVVIHANHPNEIDNDVRRALAVLRDAGATLLNQAVLLAAVNDSADVLSELSSTLFDCGVLPYYLHLLDPVAGAAHFEVPEDRAIELMASLRGRLPGYLVPRLVREIEGAPSKVVVA